MKAASDNTIYLTFDDGPHPEITPWVMDQLEAFGFKGIFFCIGDNVSKYPETYKAILERGHQTGNHTFNHLKARKTADDTYIQNTEQCASLVKSNLFRPPYGQISNSKIKALHAYEIIMWTLLAEDWNPKLDISKKLNRLQTLSRPGDIVVFHDSVKSIVNLQKLLPEYLKFLKEKGFKSGIL